MSLCPFPYQIHFIQVALEKDEYGTKTTTKRNVYAFTMPSVNEKNILLITENMQHAKNATICDIYIVLYVSIFSESKQM